MCISDRLHFRCAGRCESHGAVFDSPTPAGRRRYLAQSAKVEIRRWFQPIAGSRGNELISLEVRQDAGSGQYGSCCIAIRVGDDSNWESERLHEAHCPGLRLQEWERLLVEP